jgi:hypothetical protein
MHLTNEELLWWWAIGIAVREAAGGARSAARAVGVLQHTLQCDTLHSASSSAPSRQLGTQLSALSVSLQQRSPAMDALCSSDVDLSLHTERPR